MASTPPDKPLVSDQLLSHANAQDEDHTDGRFSVAEEVSLDQQSDTVRGIGNLAPAATSAARALHDSLQAPPGDAAAEAPSAANQTAALATAIDRAVPPSN